MDLELLLPVLSRWIHVGTAIVLVGGTTFFRFVVMPALGNDSAELVDRIRQTWKKFVHAGIGLFLLSGFYNFFQMLPKHKGDPLYHMLVGTKIILALVVFFIASALVGRSQGTQKFRDGAKKWTSIMLLLSAVIVGISGFVKVRGPVENTPTTSEVGQGDDVEPGSSDNSLTSEGE